MNETQKLIKFTIENEIKKQFGIDTIVEYVSDVSARTLELQQQCGEKLSVVYTAEHFTGTFIPAVNNNPYYILIQENRESMLDVMTAFHEYKHLTDYVLFLKTVFNNDTEMLKKSPLYGAFNVYSEYAATLFGTEQYIKIVQLENISQKELAESILQSTKTAYWDMQGIDNRYQLLVHSMQYVGKMVACSQFIDEIDFRGLIDNMELSDELSPVFSHILKYENKYQWYEELDKVMRGFVDGGVES